MRIQIIKTIMVIFIMTMGVCGCMPEINLKNDVKENKTPEETVLAYMKERYGEEFVITGTGSLSWTVRGQIDFILETKDRTPKISGIKAEYSREDNEVMRDSYLDFKMKEEIEDYITGLVDGIYENYCVRYSPAYARASNLENGISAKEYLQSVMSASWFFCVGDAHDETERNKALERIREKFAENELSPNFYIFYMPEDKVQIAYSIDKDELLHASWVYLYGNIIMSKDYSIPTPFEWRTGK